MADEGLIEPEVDPEGSTSLAMTIAALAALLALVATGAIDRLFPAENVQLVGSEAAELERTRNDKRFLDGSLARWIETEVSTRSTTREAVGPWIAAVALRFGGSAPPNLVVGSDDTLFLRDRVRLTKAGRDNGPELAANVLAAARRRLAMYETDLRLLPLARKAAVSQDLPSGMNAWTKFDRNVFSALESVALPLVNTLEVWGPPLPGPVYCALDSHWNIAGQRALAAQVAVRFPDLARRDIEFRYEDWTGVEPAMLLATAGIPPQHPAWAMFEERAMTRITLHPRSAFDEMSAPDFRGDIALVGTSFTAGDYDFHALLAHSLGTRVEKFARKGLPLLATLAAFVRARTPTGLSSVVLYEFPIHQVAQTRGRSYGYGVFFGDLAPLHTHSIDVPGSQVRSSRPGESGEWLRARFPAGAALSCGRGALGVRLEIDAEEAGVCIVRTPRTETRVPVPIGGCLATIPILEGGAIDGPIEVFAWGRGAKSIEARARLVVDLEESELQSIDLERVAESLHRASNSSDAITEHATLLVEWEGSPDHVTIEIAGHRANGAPIKVKWRFDRPLAHSSALTLREFTDGSVDAITIAGPTYGVRLRTGVPAPVLDHGH